jgi:hypothetical protein
MVRFDVQTCVQIHIREVSYTSAARRQLATLPGALHDALYEELREAFQGQELRDGLHVQTLILGERVVRANLFADKDGTLWVDAVAVG